MQEQVSTVDFFDQVANACSANPCMFPRERENMEDDAATAVLGIFPMRSPRQELAEAKKRATNPDSSTAEQSNPLERRLQRHMVRHSSIEHRSHEDIEVLPNHKVQVRLPPTNYPTEVRKVPRKRAPVDTLELKSDSVAELSRNISELTMRSSCAGAESSLNKIPDNRRMAYYAVGKHHRTSGCGGNRRCYFTGKLILGGAPFYAGSVQQGLRTLVVFCLPSALGYPKDKLGLSKSLFPLPLGPSATNLSLGRHSIGTASKASYLEKRSNRGRYGGGSVASKSLGRYGGGSVASKSMFSRLSSLDDLSLSIDGDLDPNYGLDIDYLLRILPPASADLLKQMEDLYTEQFETLPVQVRDPNKWKLFVKFCFFSGLPIAEGEMHYKVFDDIAEQVYGEEIVLTHEVMEAVNGDSAEILTLPNLKTFRYLRKHYAQQCSKLDEKIFRRACWERVAPEV
jgi:hypothetical protein